MSDQGKTSLSKEFRDWVLLIISLFSAAISSVALWRTGQLQDRAIKSEVYYQISAAMGNVLSARLSSQGGNYQAYGEATDIFWPVYYGKFAQAALKSEDVRKAGETLKDVIAQKIAIEKPERLQEAIANLQKAMDKDLKF